MGPLCSKGTSGLPDLLGPLCSKGICSGHRLPPGSCFLTSWAPSAPKVLAVATGSLRGPGSRVGEFAVIALAAHFMGLKCLSYPTVRLPAPKPSRRSSTKAYVSDLSLYGKTYSTHVLDLSLYGKTYSTHAFGWGCRNIPAREDL